MKGGGPMRRQYRLALAACLAAACLLFLPAAPAQGTGTTNLTEKNGVIETHDTLKAKIPRR